MLHWKPKPRHCDELDLAAVWPCTAQSGLFALSELGRSCGNHPNRERSASRMEYAEAINDGAAENALSFALERLAKGRSDYRGIASEAVSLAYCTCVTLGEDSAERQFSSIHRNLIDELELKLRRLLGEERD